MAKIWQNLPFKMKTSVLVAVLVGFIAFTCISYNRLVNKVRDFGVMQTRETMLQDYREELKDVVDIMAISLASAIESIENEDQIYNIFSKLIKGVRFLPDKSGYYFIYKVGGTVFTHAAQPQLEGKNLITFKDPEGKLLIEELDRVSQNGGGYVEYVWEKPEKDLQPKLSYSRMIPGTDYWIGTGVYIDDVRKKEETILAAIHDFTTRFRHKLYAILGISFVVIITPLSWLVVRSIIAPVLNLCEVADAYSLGELNLQIPAAQRKDEIGRLAQSIERLGSSSKLALDRLKKQGNLQHSSPPSKMHNTYGLSRLFTRPEAVNRLRGKIGMLQKDNRQKLGIAVMRLLEQWSVSTEERLDLLGLHRKDQNLLDAYRKGTQAPDKVDVLDRIGWLLCIDQSLRSMFTGNVQMQRSWLTAANPHFDNVTPFEVIKTQRMAGLILVATFLDTVEVSRKV